GHCLSVAAGAQAVGMVCILRSPLCSMGRVPVQVLFLFPLRPARSSRVVGGELSLLTRIRSSPKHRGRIDACLCSFDEGLVRVKGPITRKFASGCSPSPFRFFRVAVRPHRLFPLRPARSSRVVGGELSLLARIRFSL